MCHHRTSLDKLGFHTTDERKLKINDNVVLICDKKHGNRGDRDIMQFAYAQYKVDHISLVGTVVHLHYIVMLNEGSEQNHITRHPPPKLTMHVLNEFILLKEQTTADQNSSSSSNNRPELGSKRSDKNAEEMQPRHRDSAPYSPDDNDEWKNLVIRQATWTQDRKTPKHKSIRSHLRTFQGRSTR
jgi:hypothetical protein